MSTLVSRNVTVAGHRTSVRLEPAMWRALADISRRERQSVHEICSAIDARRDSSTLTAALRVFIMEYFRVATTEDGHLRAGHGFGVTSPVEPFAPAGLRADAHPPEPFRVTATR
jgi:predicted DNA-binding ribbon-helix-helix protein